MGGRPWYLRHGNDRDSFVSPCVSPGCLKSSKLLITRDDSDNYSSYLNKTVCALLTTSANGSRNSILMFRKSRFYPLNYGNNEILDFRFLIANCRALQRISAISRLRLETSSLRKIAWRCFFTIGKLKQASSAISWLLRPSQTSRATSCSRLVSRARWGKRELAGPVRGAVEDRKSSHSIRKCGRATPAEPSCFKCSVARKCGERG